MRHFIRAAVVVALALGVNAPWARASADEEPSAVTETSEKAVAEQPVTPSPDESTAGAGSLEPAEAVEEDLGAGPHKTWVESIWSSP